MMLCMCGWLDHAWPGFIDDVHGYSFAAECVRVDPVTGKCSKCRDTPNPTAYSGHKSYYHGTHVAGLVGAIRNNSIGITGVAPACNCSPETHVWMPTLAVLCHWPAQQVSNCVGDMPASSVFAALDYAVRNGAHVVSASIGQPYADVALEAVGQVNEKRHNLAFLSQSAITASWCVCWCRGVLAGVWCDCGLPGVTDCGLEASLWVQHLCASAELPAANPWGA
eukprot:43251-Chlamydomonas_euryale.AAC.2